MTKTLTTPLINLLFSATDEMVPSVQDAMRLVASGEWRQASKVMSFAAEAYEGEWHDKAQTAADELYAIAVERA